MFNSANKKTFCYIVISLGTILRLIWPENMEWKFDEQWMFEHAKSFADASSWPMLGMESGGKVKNPALSVWIFILFSLFAKTPLGLLSWVQWLNVFTIGSWLLLIKKIKHRFKEEIFLGLALFSVSPLPILFSRKIWAQNVLPFFTLGIYVSFINRASFMGAFLWGLIGGLIGQIHMSGFFFSFSIFITVFVKEFLIDKRKYSSWTGWLSGSVLSFIPMIPWIKYLLEKSQGHSESVFHFADIFKFRFITYNFMDVTGLNLKYSLGKNFYEFFKFGLGFGFYSYFNLVILICLALIAIVFGTQLIKNIKGLRITCSDSFTLFSISILLTFGLIFTMTGLKIRPHYLIILYPFPFFWFAIVMKKYSRLIWATICLQLLLSYNFLSFINYKQNIDLGDYGKTYQLQLLEDKEEKYNKK